MSIVNVSSASPYEVVIEHGLAPRIAECAAKAPGATKVAIIHQPGGATDLLSRLKAAIEQCGLECHMLPIPDAEAAKTVSTCATLWDALGAANFGRRDVIIGFGGGAATDLAGFVAATWMRGIKVIQVPTTLLAMVDAAVGGKTGINTAAGKNLVGSFHEPYVVFIDLDAIATLPKEELVAGSAEIIKTGFIADPVILERYETDPQACLRVDGYLPELIERSVAVKASVVASDLKESGLREILNYGHTFGHAVELREQFQWRHGRAVAVGMMFVANLAHGRGLIDDALLQRHRTLLQGIGLPTTYEQGCFDELLNAMGRDKKNRDGHIRFVALTDVGETTRIEDANLDELRNAYAALADWPTHTPVNIFQC